MTDEDAQIHFLEERFAKLEDSLMINPIPDKIKTATAKAVTNADDRIRGLEERLLRLENLIYKGRVTVTTVTTIHTDETAGKWFKKELKSEYEAYARKKRTEIDTGLRDDDNSDSAIPTFKEWRLQNRRK